ncbi:NAD-dependent epimerase/dehydratase family protein [bacterium]|nr:NAD-dependent epimerase/dehydratase family protein [bacterium]
MQTALITGSNGFIGSHLAEFLLTRGYHVRCMVRKTSNLQWLESLNVNYVYADLSDIHALKKVVDGVDFVFHLGGKTKSMTREGYFEANERGTQNILQAVMEINPGLIRFVYVSSQAASGPSPGLVPRKESDLAEPVTWYGESKLAGEKAVMNCADKLPVVVIRPPSVYGPRDTDVFEIFKAVRCHVKPLLGWKKRYASFIYITDLVQGIYMASLSEKSIGETFFIVSDPVVSWEEMNNTIADSMHIRAISIHIPVFLFASVAITRDVFARITGKPSIVNWQKMNEFKQLFWICDGSKALRILGFKPAYPLSKGVPVTLKWYTDHEWLKH